MVAECGPLIVAKVLPGDVGCKGLKWCRLMGYTLSSATGQRLGWFPNVELALVYADKFLELIPDFAEIALGKHSVKHAAGYALQCALKKEYGDPFGY